jgi:gamma-glutamyltranspeptidase/glutathione hydrolase
VTYTINGLFGAGVIAGHTGFFLNNEMNDFSIQANTANKFGLVQSAANNIQPGKRPLSSMTPTIVMKNGHVFMVLGSPGGPRIITAVLLTLLNVIDYQMDLQQAIDTPRIHYQAIPNVINAEPFALSFLTEQILAAKEYTIVTQDQWGSVEAIQVRPDGTLYGVNDRRRPAGSAAGY